MEAFFKYQHEDSHYSSNCGGAVRSGGNIFVYDHCKQQKPRRITAYECNNALNNMKVNKRSENLYEVDKKKKSVFML